MEREDVTFFLGAEGCSELEGEPWIREATAEEVGRLREKLGDFKGMGIDKIGRPYWPMTVLGSAPDWAYEQASAYDRKVRLEKP